MVHIFIIDLFNFIYRSIWLRSIHIYKLLTHEKIYYKITNIIIDDSLTRLIIWTPF